MTTHAHYEGEFGARLQRAHQMIEKTAQRVQKTADVRQAASIAARRHTAEAKKKVSLANKSQRPEHQAAAHAATKKAMAARAVVFTHDQDLARHKEAHAAAVTHHAATQALAAEAERKANFKPRADKARIVGSPSPDWHVGHEGRVRGEERHETSPAKKSWSDTDRFARREPPKYTPPKDNWTQKQLNDKEHATSAANLAYRRREDAKVVASRTRPLDSHPGVSAVSLASKPLESVKASHAVSLPKMSAVQKQSLSRRLDKWLGRQAGAAILSNTRRTYGIK